jgi:hypothetical protein
MRLGDAYPWTPSQMSEAIDSGEVELMTTPVGKWFWRHELMAKALETQASLPAADGRPRPAGVSVQGGGC